MDSLIIALVILLVIINIGVVFFLIRNKSEKPINPEQTFKDEFNSFKESFGQSFGSMSKEIAKDMTGALTKVDEKVSVFNQQVSELNKSQDNFSRILSGVKTYGTLAEFGLGALLKDLLPASQFIANAKMKDDTRQLNLLLNLKMFCYQLIVIGQLKNIKQLMMHTMLMIKRHRLRLEKI